MDLLPKAPPLPRSPARDESHVWVSQDPSPPGAPVGYREARRKHRRELLACLLELYLPDQLVTLHRTCPRCRLQHGKPRLFEEDGTESTLRISTAYAGGFTVFAFARDADVGVDIEVVSQDFDWTPLLGPVFSPAEQQETEATLRGGSDRSARQRRYYQRWVAKEAVLKAIGSGVDGPIDEVDTTGTDVEWEGWAVRPLPVDLPLVGALACRRCVEHVRLYPLPALPVPDR